jgi:hypothetical protein
MFIALRYPVVAYRIRFKYCCWCTQTFIYSLAGNQHAIYQQGVCDFGSIVAVDASGYVICVCMATASFMYNVFPSFGVKVVLEHFLG